MTPNDAAAQHGQRALAADAHATDPLAQPTGVTLAGDWHGQVGAVKWALRAARQAGSSIIPDILAAQSLSRRE